MSALIPNAVPPDNDPQARVNGIIRTQQGIIRTQQQQGIIRTQQQ